MDIMYFFEILRSYNIDTFAIFSILRHYKSPTRKKSVL